ncbi:unnamed protein product, partial [Nesidiocoris tenuis]
FFWLRIVGAMAIFVNDHKRGWSQGRSRRNRRWRRNMSDRRWRRRVRRLWALEKERETWVGSGGGA